MKQFFSTRSGGIIVAAAFAVIVITGAWFLSRPSATSLANAESTDQLLKAYAVKDTDGDGLPDWEEALYGTDPSKTDSLNLGMTDAQAVQQGKVKLTFSATAPSTASSSDIAASIPGPTASPDSLTEQFSRQFFNNYIQSRGGQQPTQEEMQTFIQNAVTTLAATHVRSAAYAISDLRVSGKGADALKTYAAAVETALKTHSPNLPYSELTYFSDAEQKNDPAALKNIGLIAKGYADTAAAIAKIPVPAEAAQEDLALVNALARLSSTIADLGAVQADPIRGMLGLQEYTGDGTALVSALTSFDGVFKSDGVLLSEGEPGYHFYSLIAAAQSTTQTP